MFYDDMPADDMGGAATPPATEGEESPDGEGATESTDEMGGGANM